MSTITHTTTRRGESWASSMAGLGTVGSDEVTKVKWNDIGETTLVVAGTGACVWHAGKRYELKWICGSHETVLGYWIPRIQKRLEAKRLQNRVRGGIRKEDVAERVRAWNDRLAVESAA